MFHPRLTACLNGVVYSIEFLGVTMEGDALIDVLIEATGLPRPWIEAELKSLLAKRGLSAAQLTMEHIRDLLADFLQDVLVQAKEDLKNAGL
jgi:hypothetical protein